MEFLVKVIILLIAQLHWGLAEQTRIEIDTWDDLASLPGWQLQCPNGYQEQVSDFNCVRLETTIPPEELNGEVGFWTGCTSECVLTYRLGPLDIGFGFRAYLKDMQMMIRKNDHVSEYVSGEKWVESYTDLEFTTSISLHLTHRTRTQFMMLDKIFLIRETPTTTTNEPPTNATTLLPPTGSTATTPPPETSTTEPTTTTPPPPQQVVIDTESDIPSDGRWEFDCSGGYAASPIEYDCTGGGGINFPPEDLNGEEGFWTKCEGLCNIHYVVRPEDKMFTASVYQNGHGVQVFLNGEPWMTVPGEGWTPIKVYLGTGQVIKNVSLSLEHTSSDSFVLLDKIVVDVE